MPWPEFGYRVWMRRTRLFCAIGVSLWSAAVTGSQAAPSAALSEALRAHVKAEQFQIVTSVRGLPLGVRDGLQTLFGSQTLDIAEPEAEFQVTDVRSNPTLQIRRLVAAGCSTRSLPRLLRARRHRPHVAGGAISLDTGGHSIRVGGVAPGGLKTIDDVRSAVLSGAIKGPNGSW